MSNNQIPSTSRQSEVPGTPLSKWRIGEACSEKFALYLYKNALVDDDLSLKKRDAKKHYTKFRKDSKAKASFGEVVFHSTKLCRNVRDGKMLAYDKNRIFKLIKNEAQIESDFERSKNVTKTTVVSQSVSFITRKNVEKSVSQQKCEICNVNFENSQEFETHLKQDQHNFYKIFDKAVKFSKDLQLTIDDKLLLKAIVRKNCLYNFSIKLTNTTKKVIQIISVHAIDRLPEVNFKPSYPFTIQSDQAATWPLIVNMKMDGVISLPILFKTQNQEYAFELFLHCHDEFFDDLQPVVPFKRASKNVIADYVESTDSGERPNTFPKVKMAVPLGQYPLPPEVVVVLNTGLKESDTTSKTQKLQLQYIKDVLNITEKNNPLTPQNFIKLLDLLVYIEEHQMKKDIRDYDTEDQELTPVGKLLELQVPGLAESRPSLIVSDSVFLRENRQSTKWFEGFVHQVKQKSVLLQFSTNFMQNVFLPGKKFYVSFSFNRYNLRVCHQAIHFSNYTNLDQFYFPRKIPNKSFSNDLNITWQNKAIATNHEQQQAVSNILQKTMKPAPYLIFGPPGTGKTMTVVESVCQILLSTKERVLICTPSNSAANEIVKRLLLYVDINIIFRYVAMSLPFNLIPKEIRKCINYKGLTYYQPTLNEFLQYRVIITTLTSAAKLVNRGCSNSAFDYVFIDEAGQATECETLIPLSFKDGRVSAQIVLAGDPFQLGPIIHSVLAKEYRFDKSMLERLMTYSLPYQKTNDRYNEKALTKLLKNYRSHPVIIEQSNCQFYDKELITAGDTRIINVALNCDVLPNPTFPMVFHSVIGVDQREKTSPSYFNIEEIQVIFEYLDKLIGKTLNGLLVKEEDVCIITPYKKQSDKIQKVCNKKKYDKLLVGTVEQLQGQEKLIVIISTVRSKTDLLKFDDKFHLGFLRNPKRFNVAITRAKALLIIVGNPNVLQFDDHWKGLIEYCKNNNATVGTPFEFNVVSNDLQNGVEEQ